MNAAVPQSGREGEYVTTGLPEDPGVTVVQFEYTGDIGKKERHFEAQPSAELNPIQFLGRIADRRHITVLDQVDLLSHEVQEVKGPDRRKHLVVNDNGRPNADLVSTYRNRYRLRRNGYQIYRFDPKDKARTGGVRRLLTLLAKGDNADQRTLRQALTQEYTVLDARALGGVVASRKAQEQEAQEIEAKNQIGSSSEDPILRSAA